MSGHDIIVIGASAGGIDALVKLVADLPADLPASIFVVVHVSPNSPSLLPAILSRRGVLPASHPADGEEIKPGMIYVAPPDQHLLVKSNIIKLTRGAKENRNRPSVDSLFRSASRVYGPRVIGVILSGTLDDGTAGLLGIKARGGTAVVQDPEDALYNGMPRSAIENVDVDYVLPVSEIASTLVRLAREQVSVAKEYPSMDKKDIEADAAELDMTAMRNMNKLGNPSDFSCPDCSGVLIEVEEEGLLRFRCRVGHAYSSESLIAGQSEAVEQAMWIALRSLEEKADFLRKIAEKLGSREHFGSARRFELQAEDTERHATIIRNVLVNVNSIDVEGADSNRRVPATTRPAREAGEPPTSSD
ncbi:MAG TPA: chemotaxis protein CheB [Blastocatellia bacterium]|jgi:two-component system chemotaxis response regulator CheB|nr:chemotaxis protein CheB [Blastocatellia bacterium]